MRLSPADRRLLLRAWLLLLIVRLGLWLLPFHCLRRFWQRFITAAPAVAPAAGEAHRLAWAVPLASRYVPHATCLTQALALQILLTREGAAALLRLGVTKDEQGRVTAHAWVEQDDRVLIGGSRLEHYTALDNLERVSEF